MIGTNTTEQTPATNCPADLHTATANLNLEQQQRTTNKKKHPIPIPTHP